MRIQLYPMVGLLCLGSVCQGAIVNEFGRSLSKDTSFFAAPVDPANELVTGNPDGSHQRASDARTAYLSDVAGLGGTVGIQDFESIALGAVASSTPLSLSFGSVTADLTVGTGAGAYVHSAQYAPSEAGRYNTTDSGSRFLMTNNVQAATYPGTLGGPDLIADGNYVSDFTFVFSTAVAGFGFYVTDLGDFRNSMLLEAFDAGNSLVGSLTVGATGTNFFTIGGGSPTISIMQTDEDDMNGVANGSLSFIGIRVDSPTLVNSIASIRIQVQNTNSTSSPAFYEYVGLDDLIVVTADAPSSPTVPEPTSAALVLFGVAGAFFGRRRLMAAA